METHFQSAIGWDLEDGIVSAFPHTAPVRKPGSDLVRQPVGVDVAHDCQDRPFGTVIGAVIAQQLRCRRMSDDGAIAARHGGGMRIDNLEFHLRHAAAEGRAAPHRGLRQDDAGFGLDRGRLEADIAGNVAGDGQRLGDAGGIGGGEIEPVNRHVLRRRRIGIGAIAQAQPLQAAVDFPVREIFGAPKGHVLDEMGKAALVGSFVHRSHRQAEADGDRPGRGLIPHDGVAHAVRQNTQPDSRIWGDVRARPLCGCDGAGANKRGQQQAPKGFPHPSPPVHQRKFNR